METNVGKKLCWNCEGNVHFQASQCPFCGAGLGDSIAEENIPEAPYSAMSTNEEEAIPAPPYTAAASMPNENAWDAATSEPIPPKKKVLFDTEATNVGIPLVSLSLGGGLSLLGLVLAFFASDDGLVTLQWNANYALMYLIGGAGLLAYGWKALTQLDSSSEL